MAEEVAGTVRWRVLLACTLFWQSHALLDTTPLGCFFYGWKISEALTDVTNPANATSALHCQNVCGSTAGCETFGYQPSSQDCWLGGKMGTPQRASDSFVSGPSQCSVSGSFASGMKASTMCAALPSLSFPGANAEASAAAWTTGVVPVELQCWPHLPWNGKLANCEGGPVITLEDTATGWPGTCLGLVQTSVASDTCETNCRENVTCASWQTIEDSTGTLQCWQGVGYDCYSNIRQVNVVKAQRYMHGSFRVLMDLKGYEVTGLRYAFGSSVFGANLSEAIRSCNHTCLSDLYCQAWTYSTGDGCWFDNPVSGAMQYPPTTTSFNKETQAAPLVVAGQYIQRLCTVPQDFVAPTTTGLPTAPPVTIVTAAPITTPTSTSSGGASTLPSLSTTAVTGTLASSHFVKVAGTGQVYYANPVAGSIHELRAGCASWACTEEDAQDCESAVVVSEAFLQDHSLGQDFVCAMLDASYTSSTSSSQAPVVTDEAEEGSSGTSPWVVVIVVLLLLCCCCASCNYGLWYYYVPIVQRFPWLDGYLPFQWSFGARNSFTKMREGLGSRSTDLSYDEEFPLMYPGGSAYAGTGVPQQQQYQMGVQPQYQQPAVPQGMYSPGGMQIQQQQHVDAGYDLVTVTPTGLQVTPLGGSPVPAGVPVVNPSGASFGSYR